MGLVSSSWSSDPILVKCKMENVKCPGTHCTSCVLKYCLTMCQWNHFLTQEVTTSIFGDLFLFGGEGGKIVHNASAEGKIGNQLWNREALGR